MTINDHYGPRTDVALSRARHAPPALRAQQCGRTQVTALRAAGGELGSVEVAVEEHRVGQVAGNRRLAKRATLEHGQALDSFDVDHCVVEPAVAQVDVRQLV